MILRRSSRALPTPSSEGSGAIQIQLNVDTHPPRNYDSGYSRKGNLEMTKDVTMPPDWVLVEAAKRFGWQLRSLNLLQSIYADSDMYLGFNALCDMIAKHETPPADPLAQVKLEVAREACAEYCATSDYRERYLTGEFDDTRSLLSALRAIDLWIERNT